MTKHLTPEKKLQIALEAINKGAAETSSKHGIHQSTLYRLKKTLLDKLFPVNKGKNGAKDNIKKEDSTENLDSAVGLTEQLECSIRDAESLAVQDMMQADSERQGKPIIVKKIVIMLEHHNKPTPKV